MAIILLSFFLWQDSVFSVSNELVNSDYSMFVIGLFIFLLLALDVVLPTPSSLLSLAAALYFGVVGGALLIFSGMSAACFLGYYLGRSLNHLAHSHFLPTHQRQEKIRSWTYRFGLLTLILARPIPVLAETSIIMAGMKSLPLKTFYVYTLPANALIALIYSIAGFYDFGIFE